VKQTLHLIILRTIRHNERHNILTAFSLESGRVAFAVSAGSGRAASRMRALMMPLSIVECEADIKPGRDIHTMANVRSMTALHGIHSHPVRSSLAMFLAEVLGCILRDGPPDSLLWQFIADGIVNLDRIPPAKLANFHLCFLSRLAAVLGIAPDIGSYSDGMVFDMADGRFRMTPPLHPHFFSAADSRAVPMLGRLTFQTMHLWRLSRDERRRILDGILEYYSIHYATLTGLKSLDILRTLM